MEFQRVAVLFSRLSGYMSACLNALRDEYGIELLVVRYPTSGEAPFDSDTFTRIDHVYNRSDLDLDRLRGIVNEFSPDAMYLSGWFDRQYLQVAREARKRGIPVVAGMDRQWRGSLKQRAASWTAGVYLHPAIDVLWVPGERQRQFANALGYGTRRCWSGVYACDWARFGHLPINSLGSYGRRAFLFVGRYVPEKGIDILAEAYTLYRERVEDPWDLLCAGAGPLRDRVREVHGTVDRGFIQPDDLPGLLSEASAFVLPSRHEPWGVALQEAAAAGLPLLSSDACGASIHLLQDGYNGYLFESGHARGLARAMVNMHEASVDKLRTMGERSRSLSRQFTPQRWAETFVRGVASIRNAGKVTTQA